MRIEIIRDACCAADDQRGPLDLKLDVSSTLPLRILIENIESAGFLQYSSSHTSLSGLVDGEAIVRVFSPSHDKKKAEYFVAPETPSSQVLKHGQLEFRFQHAARSRSSL